MNRADASQFSNVLAAVQRTGSLPGGPVRGLPHGSNFDGLPGINSFALELSEAQKELHLGRVRSSLERIKQLEIQFNGIANRWNSMVSSLIADVRQGKQFKNLEKLKELKAAQVKMQLLVSPARKAFQDLVAALDNDVIATAHGSADVSGESTRRDHPTTSDTLDVPVATPNDSRPREVSGEWTPDFDDLGSFASNYRCGPKLQLVTDASENIGNIGIVPKLELGKFYYLAGLAPPRVIRIRALHAEDILVFDTLRSHEATLATTELLGLIQKGVWVLVYDE